MRKRSRHSNANSQYAMATFYRDVLLKLTASEIPFLVGGGFALSHYLGPHRRTKDLDIFLRRTDCPEALSYLSSNGYRTEQTYQHWLAKCYQGDQYIDFIYSSGNGIAQVDDLWFAHAQPATLLGMNVMLCPPEEIIWSKAFIMEKERFDGADVVHILNNCGQKLDWQRLLDRFAGNWRVILSHLILYRYVYPGQPEAIPAWVMHELMHRCAAEEKSTGPDSNLCNGTLLSREQYMSDIKLFGMTDGRVEPMGSMSESEVNDYNDSLHIELKPFPVDSEAA